jgi:hypothetical protein
MKDSGRLIWLLTGLVLGIVGAGMYLGQPKPALAANDRYEDYILCTGTVGIMHRAPLDGVWLLDYRSGKLLGTAIDRNLGKIIGWAEVDLVTEFGIPPRQNVHFLMTTGNVHLGQAALYVAETTTGKLGVYTLHARVDGQPGFLISRQDMLSFRQMPQRAN